jgi:hypothetical protein
MCVYVCAPVPQVTVACLWAACFNKLLLPWSSREWAQEQISAALTAAAAVLDSTAQLQFKAADTSAAAVPASVKQSAGQPGKSAAVSSSSSSGSGSGGSSAKLASALLAQESALQSRLVEPVVAVQTGVCGVCVRGVNLFFGGGYQCCLKAWVGVLGGWPGIASVVLSTGGCLDSANSVRASLWAVYMM